MSDQTELRAEVEALKPCPFCGSEAVLREIPAHTHSGLAAFMPDHQGSWVVECGKCSAGLINTTRETVTADWNQRAALPPTPGAPQEPTNDELHLEWRDGAPPKPWSEGWFIAETTYGDRVVLRALPEEYTYDFKTADETYIKREKIKRWMQFPDSDFIAPGAAPAPSARDDGRKP